MKVQVLLIVALALTASCQKENEGPSNTSQPAVANFSIAKPAFYLNEPVQFSNASSNATSYIWDFGDGATSTEQSPSHAYQTGGIYTVKLTVNNSVSSSKNLKVHKGKSSYQVVNNLTSEAAPVFMSFFWDGTDVVELVNHGILGNKALSDTVFTNRDKISLGGQYLGVVFLAVDPYTMTPYGHTLLSFNDTTRVVYDDSDVSSTDLRIPFTELQSRSVGKPGIALQH